MIKKVICSVKRGEIEESQHKIHCVVINKKNHILFQSGNIIMSGRCKVYMDNESVPHYCFSVGIMASNASRVLVTSSSEWANEG